MGMTSVDMHRVEIKVKTTRLPASAQYKRLREEAALKQGALKASKEEQIRVLESNLERNVLFLLLVNNRVQIRER